MSVLKLHPTKILLAWNRCCCFTGSGKNIIRLDEIGDTLSAPLYRNNFHNPSNQMNERENFQNPNNYKLVTHMECNSTAHIKKQRHFSFKPAYLNKIAHELKCASKKEKKDISCFYEREELIGTYHTTEVLSLETDKICKLPLF